MDTTIIDQALTLLGEILEADQLGPYRLVICGGAALIGQSLINRTTQDVDILALFDADVGLLSPSPVPDDLLTAASRVQQTLGLPEDWLNNGPSRDDGGIFQMGLPEGLETRMKRCDFGMSLTVFYVGRKDQIFFKLYAAVDQGPGKHVTDLLALKPSAEELHEASRWACSHDPSEGFALVLREMLAAIGFANVI
jgi:hypothetical protein